VTYDSMRTVESAAAPGVKYTVSRMSFGRRMDLMRRVRDLSHRMEFLRAGDKPEEEMDAALLKSDIDALYLNWGLQSIEGLVVDGEAATPELLIERGPEELLREALAAVRSEAGLSEEERKN
jgi:hypothetical protein